MSIRPPGRMPALNRRSRVLMGAAIAAVALLLIGPRFIDTYVNWLWFGELGYRSVFTTVLFTRLIVFVVAALLVGSIVFAGLALAYRTRPVFVPNTGPNDPVARYRMAVMTKLKLFGFGVPLVIGGLAGLVTQSYWPRIQLFLHGGDFGTVDPQFGKDLGFYAFDLPFYRLVLSLLFVALFLAFLANLFVHYIFGGIRLAAGTLDLDGRDAYLPFQSGRPFAASLRGTRLSIKGAPEVLSKALARNAVDLTPMIDELAADGLRVLAVAERTLTARQAAQAATDPAAMERLCRSALKPIGLLGLADTPRDNAASLLAELGERGIGVRLITGDHPLTAAVIATELGLAVTVDQVITGTEWESLSADERAGAVAERLVFARMSPEHKVQVVQTLERSGLVTAMVGDGANDAAAIRAASVGIGVAAAGSDPARTAADMILLDGHIEALLDALDESEQLWRRVQSAVSVLLGGNAGEVAFALITSLLTGRSVLNARQMLLINMLTDALPAAALAVSKQDGTQALNRDESAMWREIAIRGAATTTGASLAWLMGRLTGTQRRAATIALIGLVSTQLAQTLADSHGPLVVSTAAGSFLVLAAVISTPGLSQLFGCTPVDPLGWGQAFLATAVATLLSVYVPALLERVAPAAADSVVDDQDADPNQDGVDLPNRRGEQTRTGVDKDVVEKDVVDKGAGSGEA